jgi:hypothetical protein
MHVCNHVTKVTKISTWQFNKMVKLFEQEIHIMQLFYANQSIRNVRDFIISSICKMWFYVGFTSSNTWLFLLIFIDTKKNEICIGYRYADYWENRMFLNDAIFSVTNRSISSTKTKIDLNLPVILMII